jgi:hypothetical protein
MIEHVCAVCKSATLCPVFNKGGACPTPVELARWYHDNRPVLVAGSSSALRN